MLKKIERFLPALIIIASILLIAYPYISEALFEHRVDSQISTYEDQIASLDADKYAKMMKEAQAYNEALASSQVKLTDPFVENITALNDTEYSNLLSVDAIGIMGYVEIPSINVYLPIYHGTTSDVLERGVGHLEGTSLPVGGKGTHSVLTGHTGLNHAKLFTDLAEVKEDEFFFIHILGETLAYQVYDIEIVLPEQTDSLMIEPDADLVTLITCTPYGVNTHRLMVHGIRTDYSEEAYSEALNDSSNKNSSQWMTSYKKAIAIGIAIVAVMCLAVLIHDQVKQKKK